MEYDSKLFAKHRALKSLKVSATRHYRALDVEAGRLFFGNTTPARNNISGMRALTRSRRAWKKTGLPADGDIDEFRRGGVAHCGSLVDSNLVTSIADRFGRLVDDERYAYSFAEQPKAIHKLAGRFFARRLRDPREIPEIGFLLGAELRNYVEHCYGSPFGVVTIEVYRTYHVDSAIHSEADPFSCWWHCDQRPIDITKLLLNLSDVGQNDGPFEAATKAKTRELLRSKQFRGRHEANFEPTLDERAAGHFVSNRGPSGSALLCNTQECLHRAGVPAQGRWRDMMQIMFVSSTQTLSPEWFARIDPGFGRRSRYYRPRPTRSLQ